MGISGADTRVATAYNEAESVEPRYVEPPLTGTHHAALTCAHHTMTGDGRSMAWRGGRQTPSEGAFRPLSASRSPSHLLHALAQP